MYLNIILTVLSLTLITILSLSIYWWKKYGKKLCQDEEVVKILDNDLVSPIDAFDNGVDLFDVKNTIAPYLIQHFLCF